MIMRRITFFMFCLACFPVYSQTITEYSYLLDNGIKVVTEKGWNYIQVYQVFDSLKNDEQSKLLKVSINPIGDLISGSEVTVLNDSGEIPIQNVTEGSYSLKIKCPLSSTPGSISFLVKDISIKTGFQTNVFISIHDVQITIDEKPGGDLCYYESKINRYAGNNEQNLNWGIPLFYLKGVHDKKINPDEPMGEYFGKIKPGFYDLLIKIEIGETGFTHKIWLENFEMKPNNEYRIKTNLNAGEIKYTGGNYEVKVIHLYPAGTADKIKDSPKRQNKMEIISFERPDYTKACPVGKYDVLVDYGYGAKFEWRKNVEVNYGSKTEIK